MANRKDLLYELEIACAILRTSIHALANRWEVSHTHVRNVARGETTSAPVRRRIRETIAEARERVPFRVPDNP